MPRKLKPVPPLSADTLTPTGNRLLVKPLPKDATTDRYGSLYLPQTAEDWQQYLQWEIVKVGPEVLDESLLPGAHVLVARFAGALVEIQRVPHAFIAEDAVIAILP